MLQEKRAPEELKEKCTESTTIWEWLIGKDEFHLEQRYMQIGARRATSACLSAK